MSTMRFPVQTLPMMFISAILATCAGDNNDVAQTDQAPAATNNVAQVAVVERKIAQSTASTESNQTQNSKQASRN